MLLSPCLLGAVLVLAAAPTEPSSPPPPRPIAEQAPPPAQREPLEDRNLVLATGVVGLAALGIGLGRALIVHKCLDDGLSQPGCGLSDLRAIRSVQAIANLGALGMSIASGVMTGRQDGAGGVRGTRPVRRSGAFIGGGVAAIAAGLAVEIVANIRLEAAWARCPLDITDGWTQCLGRGIPGALAVDQIGATVLEAGAGLLSYGIANRVSGRRARRLQHVTIAPNASLSRGGRALLGLSLSARF